MGSGYLEGTMNDNKPDRSRQHAQDVQDVQDAEREPRPAEQDPSELDNSSDGNPDAEAGADTPSQRPITDNKAGG